LSIPTTLLSSSCNQRRACEYREAFGAFRYSVPGKNQNNLPIPATGPYPGSSPPILPGAHCPGLPPALTENLPRLRRTMSPVEPTFSIREVAVCPCCRLHQYATASGQNVGSATCRRCSQPLGFAYYRFQPSGVSGDGTLPDRNSIQRSIGAFVRRLRLRRHLSQEVLSRRMVIHRTVLSRFEAGRCTNIAILFRAALALDLEIDEVFVRVRDRRSREP
jgi:ribosome-binding protein aMBF1 (putative translation factor)